MELKRLWLKRMTLGGCCAVAAALGLILLLNFLVNSIIWFGGSPDYSNIQLTTDQAAAYFGSPWFAVAVEMAAVFALGAAIGLATLPFAETWTSLLGLSVLHFFITGMLAMLVCWSYRWLSLNWWVFLLFYLAIYLLIWLVRWCVWYAELRQMRKALGLNVRRSGEE